MKKIIPIILVAVVVGGVSFFGGMKYGQSKITSEFPDAGNFFGQMSGNRGQNASSTRGFGGGGGIVSGEIISKDSSSITVKLQNGGSKIIFYSDTTEISKTTSGATTDLKEGETIIVGGTTSQDGSVTAKTIQIRPDSLAPKP
jgi:hypothetical protein